MVVAGLLLSDERITAAKIAGVVLGFAGTVIMIGPDLLAGLGDQVWAQMAILGAAVSYAFAGTYGRRFKRLEIDPFFAAAGQVTASTIILAPLVLWFEGPPAMDGLGLGDWGAIVGVALLSTAFAYVLFFRILEIRRGHQFAAGHLPGAGLRHSPGCDLPERNPGAGAFRRYGPDHVGAGHDRRAGAAGFSPLAYPRFI